MGRASGCQDGHHSPDVVDGSGKKRGIHDNVVVVVMVVSPSLGDRVQPHVGVWLMD